MARRLLLLLFLSLLVLLPAALSVPAKADRLQSLQQKIATAQAQEARLSSEIGSIEADIRSLEREVSGVSVQLDTLEHDLRLQQEKLNRVVRLYRFQTEQLDFLRREYNVSVRRLNLRLIELYEGDDPTTLDVFLSSDSISEFLEQVDYVQDIGAQDAQISTQVGHAKDQMHSAREETKVTKAKVETVTRTIAARTTEVRAEKERLLIAEKGLSRNRSASTSKRRLRSKPHRRRWSRPSRARPPRATTRRPRRAGSSGPVPARSPAATACAGDGCTPESTSAPATERRSVRPPAGP
jgi:peptidoglycan hydrolase CwlO-like protein